MQYLYVLFSRSNTWPSRIIYRFTPGEYTHVALALERDLQALYSFGRLYEQLPLPGGFVTESIHTGIYGRCGESICRVCRVPVSEAGYRRTEKLLRFMQRQKRFYHYNLFGTVLCALQISRKRRARFFCSEFVAEVLHRAGAVALPKTPHLMRPCDILTLPELETIYEGPLCRSDTERTPALA